MDAVDQFNIASISPELAAFAQAAFPIGIETEIVRRLRDKSKTLCVETAKLNDSRRGDSGHFSCKPAITLEMVGRTQTTRLKQPFVVGKGPPSILSVHLHSLHPPSLNPFLFSISKSNRKIR